MKFLLAACVLALALAWVAALPPIPGEELGFRGEIVELDVEGRLVVVKTRKPGGPTERRFEIESTTEIRTRAASDLGSDATDGDASPLALSDLAVGDYVVVRYEVIRGRNVARLIEKVLTERV